MEHNLVGWFEIPVEDMDRAKKFYDTVSDIEISIHELDSLLMGWFPFAEGKTGASGSLTIPVLPLIHPIKMRLFALSFKIKMTRSSTSPGSVTKDTLTGHRTSWPLTTKDPPGL